MINFKILFIVVILFIIPTITLNSFAAVSGASGDSPFERDFGDVKYLDAYFGTTDEKMEVDPGDANVPITIVLANVGSQDITGIRGQLSLPTGFSSTDGTGSLIIADSDSNSLEGSNFYLTFYVNVDKNIQIQQYPGTVKLDYSRFRESGTRTTFFDFNFKVTGSSIINITTPNSFLTSLKSNNAIIEISNDGTASISNVNIVTDSSNTSTSVDKVMILESNWDVGNIEPKTSRFFNATIYVPQNIKEDTLQIPLSITYNDAHGTLQTVSETIDFYIKGLIDLSIYDVGVIDLSGSQMIVGEIINEGNENALFSFITIEPMGVSNIKKQTQFIDEVEIDSPVPFNIPLKFDGEPHYGDHDIEITVRYKDSVRNEIFFTHNSKIFIKEPLKTQSDNNFTLIIIPIIIIPIISVLVGFYIIRKRKKSKIKSN
ncbi:MAG: COG1361 S-layer family protein [Nitrosarchaeum sp.]|jgi:hypothetical protein